MKPKTTKIEKAILLVRFIIRVGGLYPKGRKIGSFFRGERGIVGSKYKAPGSSMAAKAVRGQEVRRRTNGMGCSGKRDEEKCRELFCEHLLFAAQAVHFFEQEEDKFQAFDVEPEARAEIFDVSQALNGFIIKVIISPADIAYGRNEVVLAIEKNS